MTFKTRKIITGIEKKVSKKTEKEYMVINYLNDNGSTFSSMAAEDLKVPEGIKQLSSCDVEFEVQIYNGNVNGLKTIGLELVKPAA
jgi:hypothetical protein